MKECERHSRHLCFAMHNKQHWSHDSAVSKSTPFGVCGRETIPVSDSYDPLETVLFLQHNLLNLLDMVSMRKLSHSSEPVPGSTLADSPTLVQHASAR